MRALESGGREAKIRALESLENTGDAGAIRGIISRLGDPDIRVRGEAFSSLVANENGISGPLIRGLASGSKAVRGHAALVLANRHDHEAAPEIARLATDPHPSVRACAMGALGHLGARGEVGAIRLCLTDRDMDVKKCAIQAAIDIGELLSEETAREVLRRADPEVEMLVERARNGG